MRAFAASVLCVALLALALAGPARADEVLLNDGSAVEGEIQSVDEKGVTIVTDEKTLALEPEQLDVHDYYTLWSKRVPDDAEAHLRIAVFAFENGMFNQARRHYQKAERLDKEVVKTFETEVVPRIKEGVAERLLARAKAEVEAEDWTQAKRIVAKILTQLDDTKAAEEARQLLASVHLWQLDDDQKRFLRSVAKYLPKDEEKALKEQARIVGRLEPVESKMRKAQDLSARALRTKSTNRQKDIFQQAAKRFETVVGDLDKLAGEAGDDAALAAYIAEERAVAVREAVDAYVNAGNVYLVRRDYQNGLKMAESALALDPESSHAKSFQQQVLRGSQMRSGWWGRGGR